MDGYCITHEHGLAPTWLGFSFLPILYYYILLTLDVQFGQETSHTLSGRQQQEIGAAAKSFWAGQSERLSRGRFKVKKKRIYIKR